MSYSNYCERSCPLNLIKKKSNAFKCKALLPSKLAHKQLGTSWVIMLPFN